MIEEFKNSRIQRLWILDRSRMP